MTTESPETNSKVWVLERSRSLPRGEAPGYAEKLKQRELWNRHIDRLVRRFRATVGLNRVVAVTFIRWLPPYDVTTVTGVVHGVSKSGQFLFLRGTGSITNVPIACLINIVSYADYLKRREKTDVEPTAAPATVTTDNVVSLADFRRAKASASHSQASDAAASGEQSVCDPQADGLGVRSSDRHAPEVYDGSTPGD